MLRIIRIIAIVVILNWSAFPGLTPKCEAQNQQALPEYDFYSLALSSISDSAKVVRTTQLFVFVLWPGNGKLAKNHYL